MAPSSCICTPRMPNNRPFDVTKISEASFYIRMMMAPFVSRWPLLDRTPKLFPVIWKVYRRVSGGGGGLETLPERAGLREQWEMNGYSFRPFQKST